jgi:hypothetical protein
MRPACFLEEMKDRKRVKVCFPVRKKEGEREREREK